MNCIKCGEPARLQNYEDYKGDKTSCWHCDSCAEEVWRFFRREAAESRRDGERREREQEQVRQAQQQARQFQKEKEWKLSHCHHCSKYSAVYHYIYDKRTGQLTSTTSNAIDAEHQYVFCSKEHFQTWLNKHKAKLFEVLRRRGQILADEHRELEEQLAQQEELREVLAQELERLTSNIVCEKCGTSKEGQHWVNKQDHKTFCSENCYTDYYYSEKCDNCQSKITDRSFYSDETNKTGTLCEPCAIKKITGQSQPKTNSTPTNNNSNNNYSPNSSNNYSPTYNSPPVQSSNQESNVDCSVCKKNIKLKDDVYYVPAKPDTKWCATCQPRVEINAQAMQKMMAGQAVDIWSLNIPDEDKHCLVAAGRIINGEEVNIDRLQGMEEEHKEGLRELQRHLKNQQVNGNKDKDKPFYEKDSFWIILIIISFVISIPYGIYRSKKAKKMGKKYNWWIDKIS